MEGVVDDALGDSLPSEVGKDEEVEDAEGVYLFHHAEAVGDVEFLGAQAEEALDFVSRALEDDFLVAVRGKIIEVSSVFQKPNLNEN